jgi:hypothetical protein
MIDVTGPFLRLSAKFFHTNGLEIVIEVPNPWICAAQALAEDRTIEISKQFGGGQRRRRVID